MHSENLSAETKNGNGNASTSKVLRTNSINSMSGNKSTNLSAEDIEVIRLVAQQLQDMGLVQASEALMNETGCRLEHSVTTRLREEVMQGRWSDVVQTLTEMKEHVKQSKSIKKMFFLVYEQKYLEYVEDELYPEALCTLQTEIQPLNIYLKRLHELPCFMMLKGRPELLRFANWKGKGASSRKQLLDKLQEYLPMSVMMPPKRLKTLLSQALNFQRSKCLFHNVDDTPSPAKYSLLLDHVCHRRNFPSVCKQTITEHTNEVLFCQFSNNGHQLATASKDSTVIIWNVDESSYEVSLLHKLTCHSRGVGFLQWSPDDKHIAVCGYDDSHEVFIFDSQTGNERTRFSQSTDDSLACCCWSSDSAKFVTGGLKGQFYECDLDGGLLQNWEGVRVQSLACRPGSSTYLAADSQYRVRNYDFEDDSEDNVIKEDHPVMSMTLSSDGRLLLVNLVGQGIHMWDLEDKVMLRKFQGSVRIGSYHIYSTFGGASDSFIASGSEDNKVYIWHRSRSEPVETLCGHTKVVNCVTWNKRFHGMLASVSDDCTIKIWGPIDKDSEENEDDYQSLGIFEDQDSESLEDDAV